MSCYRLYSTKCLRFEHSEFVFPLLRYDEFGFRVDDDDAEEREGGASRGGRRGRGPNLNQEDPQHRLRWIAHLEFTHNQVVEDLTWDKIENMLPR